MKKNLASLIALIVFVSTAYGDESIAQGSPTNERCPHHLYFGPEVFWFDLDTHIDKINVDGVKCFGGLRLRYEYLKPHAFYAGIDLFSAVSNKSFHAKLGKFHFPINNNITGFGNFEIRMGYTIAPNRWLVTPFLGIGAYSVRNGGHSFHFHESMVYYACGVRSLFEWSRVFSLGLNGKLFFEDDVRQTFKYIYDGHKISKKDCDNTWGGELGIPLVWFVGSAKRWNIQLEPYFLKLDFSEIQNIYGTRLLFGYSF
jgi:hypothetical protein